MTKSGKKEKGQGLKSDPYIQYFLNNFLYHSQRKLKFSEKVKN